eukprot:CFRG6504T1
MASYLMNVATHSATASAVRDSPPSVRSNSPHAKEMKNTSIASSVGSSQNSYLRNCAPKRHTTVNEECLNKDMPGKSSVDIVSTVELVENLRGTGSSEFPMRSGSFDSRIPSETPEITDLSPYATGELLDTDYEKETCSDFYLSGSICSFTE